MFGSEMDIDEMARLLAGGISERTRGQLGTPPKFEVSVGKAGKKNEASRQCPPGKIEEGGNPDIRNWQCRGLVLIPE
jgi:hypothetical protein